MNKRNNINNNSLNIRHTLYNKIYFYILFKNKLFFATFKTESNKKI